ncbi:MAG TPA: heparan-alpha-glucosaminide N-acetyltransferase domain-containing protein [Rhodospirillales bacterium]|nr:heparan-alpha-glucosaminide N-acetyltransferase domain-containing protein [Rhodospirillales bacterium]
MPTSESVRLASIDLLRGVVMVLMALDHARDFFSAGGFDVRDVDDPALFLTRWVTHFCAPVFVFLAGTSAFLYGAGGKTAGEVSRFLLVRGVWLVLLEVTIVRFAWTFSVIPDLVFLQVIWVLGVSMIVLSALIHLPRWAIAGIGVGMIAFHNLLDGVRAEHLGQFGWLWSVMHEPAHLGAAWGVTVYPLYSLIPWVGVMAAGFALGPVMLLGPEARRRRLMGLGVVVTVAFVVLRAANVYGDPAPWLWHDHPVATVLAFVNTEKYPPSALFLAMTLGPALIALATLDSALVSGGGSAGGWLARVFIIFGRAPLFYYVTHLLLLQALAVVYAVILVGGIAPLLDQSSGPVAKPEGYGLGLPGVYTVWMLVVAALYLPCRWFAGVKHRRGNGWVRYL